MHGLANPNRFLRVSRKVTPWTGWAAVACILAGAIWGIAFGPEDYQQADSVRIMYVHVPSAWMALFVYVCLAGASFSALVWRHVLAHVFARAAAPVGAAFTFLALVTGSLWGKPMWGDWWAWDARLTSVLVLFFFYLGHIALTRAFDNSQRGANAAAILALVGVVNVPIVKFSVDWWSTLHQGSSIARLAGPTIDISMLAPLGLMILGFTLYFVTLVLLRTRSELVAARIRALNLRRAHG